MFFATPRLERLSFALGTYERHSVATITRLVQPGMIAYDVGANAGYLTLILAKCVGANGQVVAFEPDPKNFQALKTNIDLNHISTVLPIDNAVCDKSGTVTFAAFDYSLVGHIAQGGTAEDATLFSVPAVSLDDFVYQSINVPPHFIKIDVEGAEDQVLRGAERLLREARPTVLAEVRAGETWERIHNLMVRVGYNHEILQAGKRQMETDGLADVLFTPI